jgi:hypothetical protein
MIFTALLLSSLGKTIMRVVGSMLVVKELMRQTFSCLEMSSDLSRPLMSDDWSRIV